MKNRALITGSPSRPASRGMSLVELLVAIGIGTLIVAAMALLFANNSRSRSETERASRKIENGRYAVEVLRGELYHAGYLAEFDPSGPRRDPARRQAGPLRHRPGQPALGARRAHPGIRQHWREHVGVPERCEGRYGCRRDSPGERLRRRFGGLHRAGGRCARVPGVLVQQRHGTRLRRRRQLLQARHQYGQPEPDPAQLHGGCGNPALRAADLLRGQ